MAIFQGTPIITWPPRIFFEQTGTGAILGMVEPRTENFKFRVDYYQYLPDLVSAEDVSPLITLYPEMILAKAKAIAFTDVNDAEAIATNEGIYEKKLAEAIRKEAYAEVRGRQTHM